MIKKIIIASLLILYFGLIIFFRYYYNWSVFTTFNALILPIGTTLIFFGFVYLIWETMKYLKENIINNINKKFAISLIVIFTISFIISQITSSISISESIIGSLGIVFIFGLFAGIIWIIIKFFKEGFNSEIVLWVFWISFLAPFYYGFKYVKEEYGFGYSLGLFLVIMILIFLLYFFVIGPIAKSEDETKANKNKINELEKRIDNIEKDK